MWKTHLYVVHLSSVYRLILAHIWVQLVDFSSLRSNSLEPVIELCHVCIHFKKRWSLISVSHDLLSAAKCLDEMVWQSLRLLLRCTLPVPIICLPAGGWWNCAQIQAADCCCDEGRADPESGSESWSADRGMGTVHGQRWDSAGAHPACPDGRPSPLCAAFARDAPLSESALQMTRQEKHTSHLACVLLKLMYDL